MTRYTITILEKHRRALQQSVLRDDREYGAFLVCGRSQVVDPWTGELEERFTVRELIEVSEDAFLERTPIKMTWSTTPFYDALKKIEPKDYGIAVVHSHPQGPLAFSEADDIAEREIFKIAYDRLESIRPHLSIIMDGTGALIGRAYNHDLKPQPVDLIRVIGDEWKFSYSEKQQYASPEELDRQIRAFGPKSTMDLAQLRIGVVGCGGTGSAVLSLLGRIGVRRLAIFDPDYVDETNLNRLHYSTRTDANLRRLKVDVLGEAIARFGFSTSIVRISSPVDDEKSRDALRACDIIFGCTDDHLGRNLLNRLAHFYLIPIIDLGLLIEPNDNGGYDTFDGRVTVVQPGYPCQVCRGLINPTQMSFESYRRHDPVLYQKRRAAGYIPNAADPSPVVVTFTTEIAALAVNELFQRLNGFRGKFGACGERVRRLDQVKDSDTVPGGRSDPACKLCGVRRYDGRGDMMPFLDMT